MYKDKDKELAKKYCERTAHSHQTIKPIWKPCCGALEHYVVTMNKKFMKKK